MTMTRLAAAGFGLVALLATPALAGGPVVPAPEPVVAPPAPAMVPPALFAGGYVGAGLGYAFGGDDDVGVSRPDPVGSLELGGPVANLHAGYRWQQPGSRFVYGVEAMVSGGSVDDDVSGTVGGVDYDAESELKYSATLRGSLGYTVRPDMLLYGFAGYTVGRVDYSIDGGPRGSLDEEVDVDGYAVGLGLEKILNDRWSVRGEYQYSNFGKEELETDGPYVPGTTGFSTNATAEFHTIRVGVNYRF